MKRFFLNRSRREQVLILLFALIGLAWWGSSLTAGTKDQYRGWSAAHEEFKTQELWLEQREAILERVVSAGETLDPSRALDSAQTFAELNKMLSGLNAEVSSLRTERTQQFALHGMQVNLRRAPLADILKFYQMLSERAPYLGIDSCVISTDRSSRGMLNVNFRIYSIEVISAEE
jgi:hypothetical protein